MEQIRKRYGATDGFVKMPDGTVHYIFGFNDITGIPEEQIVDSRGKATLLGPLLDVSEGDEIYVTLTNLGFPGRPDLDDTHTIHWHGFPNQIAFWDGVPEASITVPVGRDFEYFYNPLNPGTYMYHCHFEPVEHIQMGMIAPLIVRPQIEKDPIYEGRYFCYNDISTEFNKEVLIFLTELDPIPHKSVAEVQGFDWTDYKSKYWLINGRSYNDTLKPSDDSDLPLQPFSSKVVASPGDRVLLRFVNLGFENHNMQLLGIPMKIIAKDAKQLIGTNGEDLSYWTNTIYIAPGQTLDVIFTAPEQGKYILFNRSHNKNTLAGTAFGGMVTEIEII